MTAQMMPGAPVAEAVFADLVPRIDSLRAAGHVPGLATVLIGDDGPSARYVGMKMRKAEELGCNSPHVHLPADCTTGQAIEAVHALNEDPAVDAMLVQYPAPPQVDFDAVLMAVDPDKDVDGLHPLNVGRLWTGRPGLRPATPSGVIALADRYGVELEGARAVVVGRSNLVGKPLAAMLLERNATVTLAHSRTRDLAAVCRDADVLVAAVGRPGLVTADMVKPGAAVFDVGLSRVDGKVVGDVSPDVAAVAGWLTPMPGGTGLMTVAMVVANTVEAAVRRRGHAA